MKLNELLDSSYDYSVTFNGSRSKTYEFITSVNETVEVTFLKLSSSNIWTLEFERNGQVNMTNGGDALKIFATVNSIIRDFTMSEMPDVLLFCAAKSDRSRVSLYKRMLQKMDEPGYSKLTLPDDLDNIRNERTKNIVSKEYETNKNMGYEIMGIISSDTF